MEKRNRKCKHRRQNWWSLPLAKAKLTVNMFKSHFSKLKRGYQGVASVTMYGINVTCLLDLESTKTQLWIAQKERKAILHKSAEKQEEANRTLSEIHALTENTTATKE
eukprot:6275033-Ditylum_brightwellii.AAC.1